MNEEEMKAFKDIEKYVNDFKQLVVEEFTKVGQGFFKAGQMIGNVESKIDLLTKRVEKIEKSITDDT